MSIKIALGGDVNFSRHRGEISGLVQRSGDPLFERTWRKLVKYLWSIFNYQTDRVKRQIYAFHELGNYDATYKISQILLEDYGGRQWTHNITEFPEYNDKEIPFKHIGEFFRRADIGHINLETPLSGNGRHIGMFCSSPEYARHLRKNNIGIVSLANNHSFDAGERGFLETLSVLENNDIKFVGGASNLDLARKGEIIEVGRIRIGFLAYTSLCNHSFISLAKKDQPGILPLYEPILHEDIRAIKKKCDFLIVSPHFDIENSTKIHKNSITIARKMIDYGADLIIGNHAHVPKPVEFYKGKIIIYCLGRLIFIENFKNWGNSLIAEVILSDNGFYERIRFYPINTKCSSPYILKNAEGNALLSSLKKQSEKKFKTPFVSQSQEYFLEINSF